MSPIQKLAAGLASRLWTRVTFGSCIHDANGSPSGDPEISNEPASSNQRIIAPCRIKELVSNRGTVVQRVAIIGITPNLAKFLLNLYRMTCASVLRS